MDPPVSDDTIFALASGFGRAAIAVVRISGPASGTLLDGLTGSRPPSRQASLRRLRDPLGGEVLDHALVLWLPGPHSFTGEDGAELHIHGGAAVRAALVRVLSAQPGCRPAEPGEFTRRAFLNGRMDLGAVEGLADVVDADTEAQRRQGIRQLEGVLSTKVEQWRSRLIDASALIEAGLDFTDEDDIPDDVAVGAREVLAAIHAEIDAELIRGKASERLRDGFVAVIAGPPNAGKSTLLNALAGRDIAIVSPFAGTTRDAIEVRCDLDGLPVTFVDTAGLRQTADPVEVQGIERARSHAARADLVILLQGIGEAGLELGLPAAVPVLRVRTKADLGGSDGGGADISISALTGAGMADLITAVRGRAEASFSGAGDAVTTRERHRVALRDVSAALSRALANPAGREPELVAEDLRLGLRALGRITGRVDIEEVLDRVFSQFCIGK